MRSICCALPLAAFLVLSCTTTGVPQVSSPWLQWASPDDAGFDATAIEQARVAADKLQSAAVMVVYRGQVLAAWGDVARKLELHSVRKSLYAGMYGVAVQKRLIDVSDTVAKLGVDDLQALTAGEKKAKLEDLLYARSGVYHPAAYAPSDQARSRPARGSHPAGTHWFYNNWDFNVSGALLERAARKPLGEAFNEWIARPTGMEDFTPSDVFRVEEPRTSRWPALTFRMSARDLARFGLLWLQRGKWEGRQVIDAHWIDRASQPRSELETPGEGYAMMWWTHAAGSLPAERYPALNRCKVIRASGTGGQSIIVVPELELVFVHRGDTDHGREVSSRDVWTLVETIAAARRAEPRATAEFVAMQAIPFASQLDAFEFPATVALDRATLEKLAGRYQFTPELIVTVYVHDNRLFAAVPRLAEAELFAKSPTEFYTRIDPTGFVRFEGDRIVARINGREMSGTRVP